MNVSKNFKDVPNFMKDVPNIVKGVPNFINDVPRVPKSVLRSRTTSNHFLRVSKRKKKWTMRREIGVPLAQRLYVSNFLKDVPNFFKNVPRVPMYSSGWGTTSNHFLRAPK